MIEYRGQHALTKRENFLLSRKRICMKRVPEKLWKSLAIKKIKQKRNSAFNVYKICNSKNVVINPVKGYHSHLA